MSFRCEVLFVFLSVDSFCSLGLHYTGTIRSSNFTSLTFFFTHLFRAAYLPFGGLECVNRVLGTAGQKEFHKLLFAEITGSIIRGAFWIGSDWFSYCTDEGKH